MLERREYLLTALTPLHVGSGEVLRAATDFIQLGGRLFVVDPDRLFSRLRGEILSDLTAQLRCRPKEFSLQGFLRRYRLVQEEFCRSVARYELEAEGTVAELRCFIKTWGRPYVPASSLKGSLRVAVLYRLLKGLSPAEREGFLLAPLRRRLTALEGMKQAQRRKEARRLRQRIGRFVDELLRAFRLAREQPNPRTDLLRCLRVTDAEPLDSSKLVAVPVAFTKLTGGVSATTHVEALRPRACFRVILWHDRQLLEQFRRENRGGVEVQIGGRRALRVPLSAYEEALLDPFGAAAEMVRDLLEQERKTAVGRWINPEGGPPNFRLGWGQGLLSASLFLLLPEDLRRRVRNHLFKDEGNAPAPLTRAVATIGGRRCLMGFCRAEQLEGRKGV